MHAHRRSLVPSVVASFVALACAAAPALAQDVPPAAEEKTFLGGVLAIVIGLVLAFIALVLSIWLAMAAVKRAIHMFDKTTHGIDEWTELAKGNTAVGIVMAAMVYAIGSIISKGVLGLTHSFMTPPGDWSLGLVAAWILGIVIGIVNLLIALWIATTVISVAIKALDRATEKLDEMNQIGRGNVAVAVLVAGVLLAVSTVVGSAVEGFANVLNVENLAGQFGWTLGR